VATKESSVEHVVVLIGVHSIAIYIFKTILHMDSY
jgi:hypothetical protein